MNAENGQAVEKLSPSMEDYLEAVLALIRTGQVARVRDIAGRLGVGMSSVSIALRALGAKGLVNYDPYQVVTLTDEGRRLGECVDRRHTVLGEFLTDVLGVAPAVAQANACRIEHAIDDEVLERLREFMDCVKKKKTWDRKTVRPGTERPQDRRVDPQITQIFSEKKKRRSPVRPEDATPLGPSVGIRTHGQDARATRS
jgi:DtxR family Mn-dependent transcriptional regulator